jgi:hypothetical protein
MQWIRSFVSNLEILSPDGHVMLGKLRQHLLLHDLFFFLHVTTINENLTQKRGQHDNISVTVDAIAQTDSMDRVIT